MLLALDVLLLKVMYFTLRFCSTCTGRLTVFRDEHGSGLDRTGSGLKPILGGSGLDRTAIFLKIGGPGLDRTEKIFCFDVIF